MFEHQLQQLQDRHLLRRLRTMESATGPTATLDGREVIQLSSNNYPRPGHTRPLWRQPSQPQGNTELDPVRHASSAEACLRIKTWKQPLARFKGTESALTFAAGYLANIGVIPADRKRRTHPGRPSMSRQPTRRLPPQRSHVSRLPPS